MVIIDFINIQKNVNQKDLFNIGISEFNNNELQYILNKYNIPEKNYLQNFLFLKNNITFTLEHGDFHLGNVLINKNQKICFIDFAESHFTNPLFTLCSLKDRLIKHNFGNSKLIEEEIINFYLNNYNIENKELFNLSEKIFPLYQIFLLDNFLKINNINTFFIEKINFKINYLLSKV